MANERREITVSGVTDVVSFDEQTVVLDTVCGGMTVDGDRLHIHILNMEQGIVTMDGRIDAITYFENDSNKENGGFFKKLFR